MQSVKQKGFTLVEIAIVLVIVGLLIGGVLKGQEMITNAKLKRIESDNAGIAAAMYSYQDRYQELPGDDPDAETRFQIYGGAVTARGDGNGEIGDGTDWNLAEGTAWADGGQETLKFFGHMRAAGLLGGEGTDPNRPINAYGGEIGIQNGALQIAGTHTTIFSQIEGPIAKIIEDRLDDGEPESGRIQSDLTTQAMDAGNNSSVAAAGYIDDAAYHMAFRL